ncbi:MAG: hypothetical protein WCP85_29340 [Mariniphaga sp.]
MHKTIWDRATQGQGATSQSRPRSNVGKRANVNSDGTGNTLKSRRRSSYNVFGIVLFRMGLRWSVQFVLNSK